MSTSNQFNQVPYLLGHKDRYKGFTVDEQSINKDLSTFTVQLQNSLQKWKDEGIRGVWLKIGINNTHLIDTAVKQGNFVFHHAQKDYVMLSKWLPEKQENTLPGYATHYIGVGGLVFSKDKKKILAIQERTPIIKGLWKLPGGQVDAGESIEQAAVREVFEETGIKSKMISILGFREVLKYRFEKADLYFVCIMEAENEEINVQMTHEIEKAEWKELVELKHLSFTKMAQNVCQLLVNAHEMESKKEQFNLSEMAIGDLFRFGTMTSEKYELFNQTNTLYSNEYLKILGEQLKKRSIESNSIPKL